jgi:hypothetical protein
MSAVEHFVAIRMVLADRRADEAMASERGRLDRILSDVWFFTTE